MGNEIMQAAMIAADLPEITPAVALNRATAAAIIAQAVVDAKSGLAASKATPRAVAGARFLRSAYGREMIDALMGRPGLRAATALVAAVAALSAA